MHHPVYVARIANIVRGNKKGVEAPVAATLNKLSRSSNRDLHMKEPVLKLERVFLQEIISESISICFKVDQNNLQKQL
jgi:hypothetical protein